MSADRTGNKEVLMLLVAISRAFMNWNVVFIETTQNNTKYKKVNKQYRDFLKQTVRFMEKVECQKNIVEK
jgi:hypothetical protein